MGHIDRHFRLTNEPGGFGLSCTSAGLSLAGVPLLRKTDSGFTPRLDNEVERLIRAVGGGEVDSAALSRSLDIIARALNRGDLAYAMTAAVLTRLPELDWSAAARLAHAEEQLAKYDPNQPRDWHGRWTDGDGGDLDGPRSALEVKYDDLGPVEFAEQVIQFGDQLGRQGESLTPTQQQDARTEYDFLQNRLTSWLAYGNKPADAQSNLISAAQTLYEGAVIGGIVPVGGPHGGIPASMIAVAAGAMAISNSPSEIGLRPPSIGEAFEGEPIVPTQGRSQPAESEDALSVGGEKPPGPTGTSPQEDSPAAEPNDHLPAESEEVPSERSEGPQEEAAVDVGQNETSAPEPENFGLGGVVDAKTAKIKWNAGIRAAGIEVEEYVVENVPGANRLLPGSKVFDAAVEGTGEAISVKVLDPLGYSYTADPRRVFWRVKGYINTAINYSRQRVLSDLDPNTIRSKTIQLFVRDHISSTQWENLQKAVEYGRSRNNPVSVVITKVSDEPE